MDLEYRHWGTLRLARSVRASGVSADAFFRLQIGGGDVGKRDVITSALELVIKKPPFNSPTIEVPNPQTNWQAFDGHCKNAFTTPGPQEMTNDDANSSTQPLNLEFVICIDEARYQDFDTKTALLALLSYRIPFTISNFALAKTLVSHWMHPLIDVSDDLLGQELYWNHVSVGDMGEFIAGLILFLAFDTASLLRCPEPLPLQGFLKHLLGHPVVGDLSKVSGDSLQSNLGQMLSSGTVFFNRLHRRVTAPSATDIYNMYRACTACYLPSDRHGVDILIPVWVPPGHEREAHVGCMLVRVSNKAYDKFEDDAKTSAYTHTERRFKAIGFSNQMPVIGLMMCLRGQIHSCEVMSDSENAKNNSGIILSVRLDAEHYPMFQGLPEEPETLVKQQVLRHLQSMLSEVDTYAADKNKNARKLFLFETGCLP
ncbi:hypothetical protein Cpir12675_004193 [Ceratocystis pirilliformis]|uniref:Uncharacterized protein n=1 Tax=Ceratocystis pirilliformis TaxID=259994 RepID=A0ABR3YXZ0_9PEZI